MSEPNLYERINADYLYGNTDIDSLVEDEDEKKKLEEEQRQLEEELKKESETLKEIEEQKVLKEIQTQEEVEKSESLYDKINATEPTALEDISISRRLQFGGRQEPTILGSTSRLGEAFFTSLFSDESYNEAVKRIERERQTKIFQDYPEFFGKAEDLTVLSGRMGVALADPVTFLLPWTKIAKAGRLASIGAGSAFAASDATARELSLYGEISPSIVGISAVLGGGSTALGSVLANRLNINNNKNVINAPTKNNQVEKVSLTNQSVPLVPKLTRDEANAFVKLERELYEENLPSIKKISEQYTSVGELYTKYDLLKKSILDSRNKIRKNLVAVDKVTKRDLVYSKKTKDKLAQVVRASKDLTRVEAEKLLDLIKSQTALQKKIKNELYNIQFNKLPEEVSIVGANSFLKAWQKGVLPDNKFGQNLVRAMVHEITQPLLGATAGGLVGIYLETDDDDDNLTRGLMAGAFLGIFTKRLSLAQYKVIPTRLIKEATGETSRVFRQSYLSAMKGILAGTHAAGLQTKNPVIRRFGMDTFRNQGANQRTGEAIKDSAEGNVDIAEDFFRGKLFDIFQDADDDLVLAVGRIVQQRNMPKKSKFSFLEKGDLQNKEAVRLANELNKLDNTFKQYVKSTGIQFEEADAYGLTQLLDTNANTQELFEQSVDILKEAFKIQSKNHKGKIVSGFSKYNTKTGKYEPIKVLSDKEAEKIAIRYLQNSDSSKRHMLVNSSSLDSDETASIFLRSGGKSLSDKNQTAIQSAKFFENERVLFDQEARAYAKKLFIQDPIETHLSLFENTIRVAEFARKFGDKGQGIRVLREQLRNYYNSIAAKHTTGKIKDFTKIKTLSNLYKKDIATLEKSINGYFGVFNRSVDGSIGAIGGDDLQRTFLLSLTAMLSMTKLTKVALPSLGDILQTMQNSGFKAAYKGLANYSKKSFGKKELALRTQPEGIFGRAFSGRKYNGALEKELSAFALRASTADSTNAKIQRSLVDWQRNFFEVVQLGRVTRFAREYAFDAGVYRSFDLGKILNRKGKLSRAQQREIDLFGLNKEQMQYLGKFKTLDDAYSDSLGKTYLNQSGRRSADRDALIPQVGNRRLFSQSEDPLMRFAGSFLSWAQAKVSQTSSLIRRIEDGDGKLALTMLTVLPLYAAVRDAYVFVNPNAQFREEAGGFFEALSEGNVDKFVKSIADAAVFSGQTMPWYIDKIVNSYKFYGNDAIESVYPIVGLINSIFREAGSDKPLAAKSIALVEETIPFGKDIVRSQAIGEIIGLEDDRTIKEELEIQSSGNVPMSKGGLVEGPKVPNTKEDPADAINPNTGLTYSGKTPVEQQMEDLLEERIGFANGGEYQSGDLIDNISKQFMSDVEQRAFEVQVAEQINELVEKGQLADSLKLEITGSKNGIRYVKAGNNEAFNTLKHLQLGIEHGDSFLGTTLINAREIGQILTQGKFSDSIKDIKNNLKGLNLFEQAKKDKTRASELAIEELLKMFTK